MIIVAGVPFKSALERDLHFAKHGHKFRASDALQYERMADEFMFGALGPRTHECFRPEQHRVRFDFGTYHEGVVCRPPEFVRTFYPVRAMTIARYGGETGYFAHECDRVTSVNL